MNKKIEENHNIACSLYCTVGKFSIARYALDMNVTEVRTKLEILKNFEINNSCCSEGRFEDSKRRYQR